MYSGGLGMGGMGGCYGGGYGGYGGGYGSSMGMGGMGGMGMRGGYGSSFGSGAYGSGAYGSGSMYGPQGGSMYDQAGPGMMNQNQQQGMMRRGPAAQQHQQQRAGPAKTASTPGAKPVPGQQPKAGGATATSGNATTSGAVADGPEGLNQTPNVAQGPIWGNGETEEGGIDLSGTVDQSSTMPWTAQGNPQQQPGFDPNDPHAQQQGQYMTEEEHTHQRRTFFLQALMELSNLFAQFLQPLTQFVSLGFGSYMGISSIRNAWGQQGQLANGGANEFLAGQGGPAPALPAGGARGTAGVSLKSKLALGVLTMLLFMLVERLYQRFFGNGASRAELERRRRAALEGQDSSNVEDQKLLTSGPSKGRKQLFIARYAFKGAGEDQLSFQPGDRFMVEHYDPNHFVSAEMLLSEDDRSRSEEPGSGALAGNGLKKGLIPGNYIEPLNIRQKF